jgi:hypothetical protein
MTAPMKQGAWPSATLFSPPPPTHTHTHTTKLLSCSFHSQLSLKLEGDMLQLEDVGCNVIAELARIAERQSTSAALAQAGL